MLARLRTPASSAADELLASPLRGEPLGPDHLVERAAEVAATQRLATRNAQNRRTPLLDRLNQTRRVLASARRQLAAHAAGAGDVGPAGEWLLDNYHVVEEHIRDVHESLPRGYYRQLPLLADGPLAGYPRVYEVAITLISHTEGQVDLDSVELVVGAFQRVAPLTIGELWAVPAMLRLGCLESVRRMALRAVQRLSDHRTADAWADHIEAAHHDGGARRIRAVLDALMTDLPSLTPFVISRLLQRLRPLRGANPALMRLEQWLGEEALSAEDADALATQRLALTQLVMGNSITSLRAITHADWRAFVERQSAMEAALQQDATGAYGRMDFATRDRYRHVVEGIAKRTGAAEEAVAEQAVALGLAAQGAAPSEARRAHVGYYLVDAGRDTLDQAVGYRATLGEAIHRGLRRHPDVTLFGGAAAVAASLIAVALWIAAPPAAAAWFALALLLAPVLDVAITLANQLITALLPPRHLPKLDLDAPHGIPPELRTAVVVPTLLGSVEVVRDALEHLEVQFLANRDPQLHFALLSDFTDADAETLPGDAAILAAAEAGVRALNARHAPRTHDAFHLFHRPRRWNPQEGVWMGWERKRGKLGAFNRFVRGDDSAFMSVVGRTDALRDVRYVITLDADTVLPPGAARVLIGTMAHPLNRATYDEAQGRVTEGYGILQPRVAVSLPSALGSRFAAIHSGRPGVDPYTTAVSDVYQDLYGEGSFTGKGIYDVDVFEQATHGRFAENTLLSHDLIEGSYARAGLATDVVVYDDYPARYLTYTRRKRRWIRGDWQLLRWLTPRVPGPRGTERNRLSRLSRWRIFDNLRRSTLEIGQLALIAAGWTFLPGSPLRWTLLAVGLLAAPWLAALLVELVRPPFDRSWRVYYAAVGRDAVASAKQIGLALAFLPHQAWISACAIVRTLWRLGVSRRHLLEWETASAAERADTGSAPGVLRTMWPALAIAASLLAVVVARATLAGVAPTPAQLLAVLPLGVLWLASPLLARALSRAPVQREAQLSPAARDAALRYARHHWAFFERFVSAETHWLAPDNYQDDPTPLVAMRTSPTNIGLQLLADVSAYDLGFVSADTMTLRLERTFATLGELRRHRGHFYNWYDLHDLRVLEPDYVSTVDSGNLAGHLIAVRQACLAIAKEPAVVPALAHRLAGVAERALGFVLAMDFRFLYDRERRLFAIGYHASSHTRDASFYDLLGSEARLASFVAIIKQDVPVDHWFHLDRTFTRAADATALVSWSGSMFEYLMPALVMRALPSTILAQSGAGAVRRQIAYGEARGIPWGISESAYNVRDRHLTYQYRAFGVPDLALKRGLERDLVVAPYASALAALVAPVEALANLGALEALGALGEFGFRDALDYTRPEADQRFALVRNYMAHHVGMTLVALTNVVTDGVWVRRFHAEPMVKGAELLLHEGIPRQLVLPDAQAPEPTADRHEAGPDERPVVREITEVDTPVPHVALLGRLPYTIMLSQCGSGYSRFETQAVTRWRADGTADATGQFCYVKDVDRGRSWSAAHQPVCAPADRYRALLATDRVTYERLDGDIETRMEIAVTPDDAAEVRRVTVTNRGDTPREIELTSYGEVVLAAPEADRAHPAFGNLFVETEWHAWCSAITATRRPRSASERPLWCVHVLAAGDELVGAASAESDRARFLGRGRSVRDPLALETDGALSGTVGAVLDPIVAIRARLRVAPGQSACVAFTTLVATSRERAFALADRYHDPRTVQRALGLAWAATQAELRELGLSPADAATYQELVGHLLYPSPALRASQAELQSNEGSQPLLWTQGISGDWPILLASIDAPEGIPTLRELFAAHHYWRRRGMVVDLVIINEHASGYAQTLGETMLDAMYASNEPDALDRPGGVFFRRGDQLDDATRGMLRATARVHVHCTGQTLAEVLEQAAPASAAPGADVDGTVGTAPPQAAPSAVAADTGSVRTPSGLLGTLTSTGGGAAGARTPWVPDPAQPLAFDNGLGGLTPDGSYRIRVRGDVLPPAPWANVIANEHGGFIVSERGTGCTWAGNSYFFRITPWHNDPVTDPPCDVIYLGDAESGELWSATPAPVRSTLPYTITHGQGATAFTHERAGIATRLTLGLAEDSAARLSILTLTNTSDTPRRITVTSYAEWTLGVTREHTQHQVRTSFDPELGVVLAQNRFAPEFADWVAFSAISEPVTAFTADRREFLGRNGSLTAPRALTAGAPRLTGTTGAALDPCAALQCEVALSPGETREVTVLLGAASTLATARQAVAAHCTPADAAAGISATRSAWARRLGVIQVRTPEASFDAMLNHWTLYQALGCRMWARSATYQSSGAYGFRDQLQDTLAFVYAEPGVARAHILRAAARQFVEGDVQHWWHPGTGRGVRTRFSDDLAWLPYVVERYAAVTGDATVLDESVPFLETRALEPHEHEVYDLPLTSATHGSVYDHCLRALRRACTTGAHGLPLIGSGDWNDGMNHVGSAGRGESVWLAWFLIDTLGRFADVARGRGDADTADELRAHASAYTRAVEAHGWDGAWYRRAYFDDGSPLGSSTSEECQIDSIAQSWSVISGAGAPVRTQRAMHALQSRLVDPDSRLLMLLTPPFDRTTQDPGYIKGYLPGVRENGAQYTHAALWAVLATAMQGDGDRALALFQMINPLTHARTPAEVDVYRVEPYVVAADVYTAAGHVGRGGWTWYTGSASWMYRIGLETILGFTRRGDQLTIVPRVPASWPEFTVEYEFGRSRYRIVVHEPAAVGARGGRVSVDDVDLSTDTILLRDDGASHQVVVRPVDAAGPRQRLEVQRDAGEGRT